MKCPFCGHTDTQVIDSRVSEPGGSIRRRRRCVSCTKRFTTYETVELRLPQVVKTNGTRSDFDVMRVRNGFQRALHKRPVPTEFVDQAVDRVIARVLALGEREIPSRQVGEMVMQELYLLGQGCVHPFRFRLPQFPGRVRLPRRAEGSRGAGEARAQVGPVRGTLPMTVFSDADRAHMARALALAEKGLYTTTPNPRVGCVIVKNGEVIGEGWHERAGEAHAEINALAQAKAGGREARGATLYSTLEPCNHVGRTSSCAEAVIAAGVARVVVAMADPNPEAAGGTARMRAAGIGVDVGLLESAARELNIGFVSRVTRGRPWVRLKSAASLDGRTALESGVSQWITGEAARADGHRWRARACAILTGIGTVQRDDPQLTVRAVETPRQPRRIVIDRDAETPPSARVLAGGDAWIVTAGPRNAQWPAGVEVLVLPDADRRIDLPALMRVLGSRGINELHVEAGGKLNGALFAAGLVDEILLYLAPCLLGDPARGIAEWRSGLSSLSDRVPLDLVDVARVGDDLRIISRVGNERVVARG